MIKASREFRMFLNGTHVLDGSESEAIIVNWMYGALKRDAENKDEWLRRGQAVISFLEAVLKGSHTDEELADMWFHSGAIFYLLPPDIRPWLTFLLEKTGELQAQNEAGVFVHLDADGAPWTPRQ